MNLPTPHTPGELGRGLVRALRNTGIIVFYQTPDLKVQWAQNVPRWWGDGDIAGMTDSQFLPAPTADRSLDLKRGVLASGVSETLEFSDGGRDGGRWYDMWIDADHGDDGSIEGIVTTIVEITDRKHREQTLRTLLREVSHRSKNLLAIIQSVATQTGRYSDSIETFLDRFRGRLQSLSSSQDLVTASNWRGAMLSELVKGQVARFRGEVDRAVRFEGADVYLNPNAALHIGLALHELVVNSMSHGALSRPAGEVRLSSVLEAAPDGDVRVLVLTWSEQTDFSDLHRHDRFGGVALERVVPLSLDGSAQLSHEGGRFDYRLEVPAGNFQIG